MTRFVLGLALTHNDPTTVAPPLQERRAWITVAHQTFLHPLLKSALRIFYVAMLGGTSDQSLKCHAYKRLVGDVRENERPVLAVAGDQAVLVII